VEKENGVKIYRVGECDWVFAEDEIQAKAVMVEMVGPEHVNEIIEDDPIEEMSQKDFDKGKVYWDADGDIDRAVENKNLISYKEGLAKEMEDGSKSGHFITTEW